MMSWVKDAVDESKIENEREQKFLPLEQELLGQRFWGQARDVWNEEIYSSH